jgi:hypothetical protein
VVPYEGRYDALLPTLFSSNKTDRIETISNISMNGEIRDMKWLNYGNGKKLLVIARNNQELLFYKPLEQ